MTECWIASEEGKVSSPGFLDCPLVHCPSWSGDRTIPDPNVIFSWNID